MIPLLAASKTVIQGIPMSHIAIALSIASFMFVLPALLEPKKFREAMDEFFRGGHALLRLAAFAHLFVAFLILNTHWTFNWDSGRALMTGIGYLLVLRGLLWLWAPGWVTNMSRKFLQKEWGVYVVAFVGLIFAVGFGYLGLWVF